MGDQSQHIKPVYKESIGKVLHFINQNLAGDLSLEVLAEIASYSPFHFQKLFSEALQETPKQYVIRLRLERAAHFIKIFPEMAIQEIAVNCGFSSTSIFSRAFKNYYGVSAEVYRDLPSGKLHEINSLKNPSFRWSDSDWINPIIDIQEKIESARLNSQPTVGTIYPFRIACILTTLAAPRGLISPSTKYFGIWLDFPFITPADKCRYLCGIEIGGEVKSGKGISLQTVAKGTYLKYDLTGPMNETLDSLVALNHNWVDSMGYVISEMICYEQFAESPADQPYETIARKLIIPVCVR